MRSSVLERAALQHRTAAGTRDAAKLSRRRDAQTAHCLEAALVRRRRARAARYPPLVISFESIDELDHVIFVYQRQRGQPGPPVSMGIGGALARPGTARAQAGLRHAPRARRELSRHLRGPHGRITAFTVVDLRDAGRLRLAPVGEERLEGRADAARHAAPAAAHAGGEVPGVP